jgi:GDP-L-fucose synthase
MFPTDRIVITESNGPLGSALSDLLHHRQAGVPVPLGPEYADPSDPDSLARWLGLVRPIAFIQLPLASELVSRNGETAAERAYTSLRLEAAALHAVREAGVPRFLRVARPGSAPVGLANPLTEESLLASHCRDSWGFEQVAMLLGLRRCLAARAESGSRYTVMLPAHTYGGAACDDGDLVARLAHLFLAAAGSAERRVRLPGGAGTLVDLVHVRDLAGACLCLLAAGEEHTLVNVGCGEPIALRDLAVLVRDTLAPGVAIEFEHAAAAEGPILDPATLLALGWSPSTRLADGVAEVCARLRAATDRPLALAAS